jgi:hypothetical protein
VPTEGADPPHVHDAVLADTVATVVALRDRRFEPMRRAPAEGSGRSLGRCTHGGTMPSPSVPHTADGLSMVYLG